MLAVLRTVEAEVSAMSRWQRSGQKIIRSTSTGKLRPLSTASAGHLRCVMLNAARLDYDGRISFDKLRASAEVVRHDVTAPEDIVSRVTDFEVVMNKELPIPGDTIRAFPDCVKLICEAGTGYNNIDLTAACEKGISVCNVPTYATEAMAHMSITLVMALACSLWPQAQALQSGNRTYMNQCHLGALPHFELTGKTFGLIGGLGTIGLRVAAMSQALGMRVVASDLPSTPTGTRDDGIEVVSFEELMARADFVSVHCPLNAHTKGLVDARALSLMKPTAYLVNTARGSIVDQPALVDALRDRRIAGAALDVFGEGCPPPLASCDPRDRSGPAHTMGSQRALLHRTRARQGMMPPPPCTHERPCTYQPRRAPSSHPSLSSQPPPARPPPARPPREFAIASR